MRRWARFAIHNCVAHPLLVIWPSLGQFIHDITIPTEEP